MGAGHHDLRLVSPRRNQARGQHHRSTGRDLQLGERDASRKKAADFVRRVHTMISVWRADHGGAYAPRHGRVGPLRRKSAGRAAGRGTRPQDGRRRAARGNIGSKGGSVELGVAPNARPVRDGYRAPRGTNAAACCASTACRGGHHAQPVEAPIRDRRHLHRGPGHPLRRSSVLSVCSVERCAAGPLYADHASATCAAEGSGTETRRRTCQKIKRRVGQNSEAGRGRRGHA